MDEKIYTIILADGTVIGDLTLNGNNFISDETVDPAVFEANCSPVVIHDGENEETHEHMELVQSTVIEGKTWFILRDISEKELAQEKIKSDIEYIAMMCGVEL